MPVGTAVPRSIRFASAIAAVALLGACAESNSPAPVTGPDFRVRTSTTTIMPTKVFACVEGGGSATFSATFASNQGNSGVVSAGTPTGSMNVVVTTAGACQQIATSDAVNTTSIFNVTVAAASGGTLVSATCVTDAGATLDCTLPGLTAAANNFHGTVITVTVTPAAPPPPPPPPPSSLGCTVTRGFIMNQIDLITNDVGPKISVTINGQLQTKAQILAAVSAKGGGLVQLKAQLVTALANVSLGASTNAAVDQAILDAQALLAANSTNKTAIGAAIETLTAFNEGTAGGGAADHCDDEEEAILKDKRSVA